MLPETVPFPLGDGTESSAFDDIVSGPAAALTAVALVAGARARASGWAAEAAVAVARRWQGPRRLIMVDLDLDQPRLHELLGVANDEGVIDLIEYGLSPGRVVQRVPGAPFELLPAGVFTPDPGAVLRDASWGRVLVEVAAVRATLLCYVPMEADGADAVIERAGAVLVLAEPGEVEQVIGRLEHPYAVLAVLTRADADDAAAAETFVESEPTVEGAPVEVGWEPPAAAEATEPSAAPEPRLEVGDEELEPVFAGGAAEAEASAGVVAPVAAPRPLLDDAERRELIAAVRERQRAARLARRERAGTGTVRRHTDRGSVPPGTAGVAAFAAGTHLDASAAVTVPPDTEAEPPAVAPAAEATEAAVVAGAGDEVLAAEEAAESELASVATGASVLPGTAAAPAEAPAPVDRRSETPAPAAPARPVAPARPAPGAPVRLPPRRLRHPMTWTVGVVLLASLLAGALHFLGERLPARAPVATPPAALPTPAEAEPARPADALPYAVALEAHRDLARATERVEDLRQIEPTLSFHVAPLEREGTLFYHVMAGPVADSAAAAELRDALIRRGHKTAATPNDVRLAPYAFLIGDYAARTSAEQQLAELRRLDIPGYVVQASAADGEPVYRLYVGGFGGRSEASVVGQLLRAAGIRDSLVTRTGSSSP